MTARRAAIGLLVIVCITSCGCGTPGPFRSRPDMVTSTPTVSNTEPPIPGASADKSFTIEFTTFIPANHLVGPTLHPQSYGGLVPPSRLIFAGDDRGFDVDATSYRARQVVTVI